MEFETKFSARRKKFLCKKYCNFTLHIGIYATIGTSTPWYWTQLYGVSFEDDSVLLGLSCLLHCDETQQKVEKLLWKVKRRFPVSWMPEEIRTDSFAGYYPAIMKVFSREVKHDKFKSFEEHSNNEIECFFRCKKRLPKFKTPETAKPYLKLGRIEMARFDKKWRSFIIRGLEVILDLR